MNLAIELPIVIIMEDDLIHTLEHPYCTSDPTCPCRQDEQLAWQISQTVPVSGEPQATAFVSEHEESTR
jgi:hypothetical protein